MSYYNWGCNEIKKRETRYFTGSNQQTTNKTDSILINYKKGKRDFYRRNLCYINLRGKDLGQPYLLKKPGVTRRENLGQT